MTDQPATRAGRELLLFWEMHRRLVHGTDPADAIGEDIAEVEAQARQAALDELEAAVNGLTWTRYSDQPEFKGVFSEATEPLVNRSRVLALIAAQREKGPQP